jgi:hypothetical protein
MKTIEDGYFDSENHLVLLGSAGLGNSISDMTAQGQMA